MSLKKMSSVKSKNRILRKESILWLTSNVYHFILIQIKFKNTKHKKNNQIIIKFMSDMDEELFVRYNSTKALDWLKAKTDRTVDALVLNNICVSSDGCKVNGYTSGREDQNKDRGM